MRCEARGDLNPSRRGENRTRISIWGSRVQDLALAQTSPATSSFPARVTICHGLGSGRAWLLCGHGGRRAPWQGCWDTHEKQSGLNILVSIHVKQLFLLVLRETFIAIGLVQKMMPTIVRSMVLGPPAEAFCRLPGLLDAGPHSSMVHSRNFFFCVLYEPLF